jgi:hypothetical protein
MKLKRRVSTLGLSTLVIKHDHPINKKKILLLHLNYCFYTTVLGGDGTQMITIFYVKNHYTQALLSQGTSRLSPEGRFLGR